jgi:hypothetical protein
MTRSRTAHAVTRSTLIASLVALAPTSVAALDGSLFPKPGDLSGEVGGITLPTEPPPDTARECTVDADCQDELFCNGLEYCSSSGTCVKPEPACDIVRDTCSEAFERCEERRLENLVANAGFEAGFTREWITSGPGHFVHEGLLKFGTDDLWPTEGTRFFVYEREAADVGAATSFGTPSVVQILDLSDVDPGDWLLLGADYLSAAEVFAGNGVVCARYGAGIEFFDAAGESIESRSLPAVGSEDPVAPFCHVLVGADRIIDDARWIVGNLPQHVESAKLRLDTSVRVVPDEGSAFDLRFVIGFDDVYVAPMEPIRLLDLALGPEDLPGLELVDVSLPEPSAGLGGTVALLSLGGLRRLGRPAARSTAPRSAHSADPAARRSFRGAGRSGCSGIARARERTSPPRGSRRIPA